MLSDNDTKKKISKTMRIFGLFVMLLGFATVAVSITPLVERINIYNHGEVTEGEVTELRAVRGGKYHTYAPVVTFAVAGKSYKHDEEYSSNPPAYDVGEKVEIIYLPDNPEAASIKSFGGLWGSSILVISIGLLFAVIGFFIKRCSIQKIVPPKQELQNKL